MVPTPNVLFLIFSCTSFLNANYVSPLLQDTYVEAVLCGIGTVLVESGEVTIPSGPYTLSFSSLAWCSDPVPTIPKLLGMDIYLNVTSDQPLIYVGSVLGTSNPNCHTLLSKVFNVPYLPLTGSLKILVQFSQDFPNETICLTPCSGGTSVRFSAMLIRSVVGLSDHWYFEWPSFAWHFLIIGIFFGLCFFALCCSFGYQKLKETEEPNKLFLYMIGFLCASVCFLVTSIILGAIFE
jgi:hypothetical protein